jgi:hypothetical protein
MDRSHPHLGPGTAYDADKTFKPLVIEAPGQPSRWITLEALRVLKSARGAG